MATKLYLIFILCCCSSIIASGQDNYFIQKLISEGRVIKAIQQWNVEDDPLLCVYSSMSHDSIGISSALSFFQKGNDGNYKEIFHHPIDYHLVAFFQTCEYKGNLLVIWIAGSGYHFTVFSYLNGMVNLVLRGGSKVMPELICSDSVSDYQILVTHKQWEINKKTGESNYVPIMTAVYKWAKDHYEEIDVSYKKRFEVRFKKK